MALHEKLRIHHAVGSRVLLDSDQQGVRFNYEQRPEGWLFTVYTDRTPQIEEILRLKDELNVFIFREDHGEAVEKVWFYAGQGEVKYHPEPACLTIMTHGRIAYRPQDFHV
ncbi:hypothetical protein JI721_09225 [Alicyclobacillus cycloheptanicus]|uniref:Uncharacterized protein n=1 Tax=Alicyclobacillus cycloheptanicus TaxID=1457 RepID=A0ABT9XH76_9BACL|nr:hypothetical protein [Alicyclobacillus cycloheptanicus]MDQ0189654.1 hypothetical protein [Alicyclobacillus cycloheptanicus]WDL99955.1 hypothetical protein JI721_09225 [Alicyclobacillus cycloheptanicus]